MKISFKEIDHKMLTEIYVNDVYVGEVRNDVFNNKWTLHPDFEVKKIFASEDLLKAKYDSAYDAGKALAKIYNRGKPKWEDRDQIDFDFNSLNWDFGSDLKIYHDTYLFLQEPEG
jgi:hypothetical protein